ncbi:MAG: hypothetical protein NDJ89_17850 [Oligoflexia bacterium]|nr:hypothetical protein [Oligoflexia bacterium]
MNLRFSEGSIRVRIELAELQRLLAFTELRQEFLFPRGTRLTYVVACRESLTESPLQLSFQGSVLRLEAERAALERIGSRANQGASPAREARQELALETACESGLSVVLEVDLFSLKKRQTRRFQG